MSSPLSGLVAAPFTAFQPDGELFLPAIPVQAKSLVKNGVRGAFVCGTTGEGASLTSAERKQVAEAWRSAAPKELKLAVHVGHLSLKESQALAQHAQEIGADAIATIAPSFFKPATVHDLVEWCIAVAKAAPVTPFYYYHMPGMTGVNIAVKDFLPMAMERIPNFAGIKFTHEDLADYASSYEITQGRFSMLFGRDEILLSGLTVGAAGAVGSTYNYAAPLYLRVMEAFARGDMEAARRDQARAQQFIDVMSRAGGLPAGKAIMKFIGIDCGPVRQPLTRVTAEREAELHRQLSEIGFFDYASRT